MIQTGTLNWFAENIGITMAIMKHQLKILLTIMMRMNEMLGYSSLEQFIHVLEYREPSCVPS